MYSQVSLRQKQAIGTLDKGVLEYRARTVCVTVCVAVFYERKTNGTTMPD